MVYYTTDLFLSTRNIPGILQLRNLCRFLNHQKAFINSSHSVIFGIVFCLNFCWAYHHHSLAIMIIWFNGLWLGRTRFFNFKNQTKIKKGKSRSERNQLFVIKWDIRMIGTALVNKLQTAAGILSVLGYLITFTLLKFGYITSRYNILLL